ncbi:MAG: HD family hydrolase [Hyphomicrobiaceae bacterium]|nr:HD family hydrolase [Hyphomicrobiaceae bacterium]
MARGEQRAWQRMLSGRRLDLLNPSPLDVEITDIAHGLARVARWNGQTTGDYAFSVAQHSILVLHIYVALAGETSAKNELYALLHDAPEYVMGDIISPFKAVMGGNYKDIENHLLGAIHARFSLPALRPAVVTRTIKKADKHAAYFEAVHLAGFEVAEAQTLFGRPDLPDFDIDGFGELIRPWPTQESQDRFLSSFEGISGRL